MAPDKTPVICAGKLRWVNVPSPSCPCELSPKPQMADGLEASAGGAAVPASTAAATPAAASTVCTLTFMALLPPVQPDRARLLQTEPRPSRLIQRTVRGIRAPETWPS